nr:MAG TPA: hypothetical protein [Caudoviricetes sp.]
MSKYTRSLPIPIITLLNKNRELIYDARFPNMAIVGHALCVSKAKRTALACAHSEAQASKRRTVGFYKDPVFSADDISYGLLAFHYLDKSQAAIEPFMDAFDTFLDTVPELALEREPNVSEAREVSVEASVDASVSANVSERERESAETSPKASTKASTKKKDKTSTKKTGKRKSKDKTSAKNEREALSKVIARKYESTSTQPNPKISIQRVNKEAHEANDYLRSVKPVAKRSALILDAINDAMMNDSEIQKRGVTFDETAMETQQVCVDRLALDTYMPLTTDERMTLMQVIYQKYVKGQKQDETTDTDSTTQDA